MPSAPVGADIESLCGKCGDVWHVVAAKVGDRVVRVVCKQCGNQHLHRPPGKFVAGTANRRVKAAPSAAKSARGGGRRRPSEPEGPAVEADPNRPVRAYRPVESYTPGDRIDHPVFGRGVVESSPGPGKIQVFFQTGSAGRRVLAVAKASPTLTAPGRRPDES